MKRILVVLLLISMVAGIALMAGVLNKRVFAANTSTGYSGKTGVSGSALPHVQMNIASIPEPASIVLASLALLGWITLLRRRRLTRRA
jgi:PEP-CTERM motif-containing protein